MEFGLRAKVEPQVKLRTHSCFGYLFGKFPHASWIGFGKEISPRTIWLSLRMCDWPFALLLALFGRSNRPFSGHPGAKFAAGAIAGQGALASLIKDLQCLASKLLKKYTNF